MFFSVHPTFPHAMLLCCTTEPRKNMFHVAVSEHLEILKTSELRFLRQQRNSRLSHGSFDSQFLSNFYSHHVTAAVAQAKATRFCTFCFMAWRV